MRIAKNESKTIDQLIGSWKKVGSGNGELSQQVSVGVVYEKGTTKSSTFGTEISASATAGVKFLGSGGETTITATASY